MTVDVRTLDDRSPDTRASLAERLARDGVLASLARLRSGALTVAETGHSRTVGDPAAGQGLDAALRVHDPSFWLDVATGGAVGAAESYMRGEWDTDDLVTLVRLLARDRDVLAGLEGGLARLRGPALLGLHALRRNTRRGSRENIRAHYDLGNEFFALFLDPTLMYSCAVFPHAAAGLDEAAVHKLDVVCDKLRLEPGMHVLEIGTGWGGFAIHAARRHGVHVTTTTISAAQYETAARRVREAGLEDRVTLLREDYRDLPRMGRRFDRVVSLEMIEAVGHEYLHEYFRVLDRMLAPDGRAVLQAIVIRDQDEAAYRRGVDFIQRHVFPGGALPSVRGMTDAVARVTRMRTERIEDYTPHYARTLRAWRARFEARLDDVRAQGFDERFVRQWRWYFCYCEAGFLERTCGLVQLELAGPTHGRGEGGA
ncbi:MAG: cyclopropane-fatty-acyl-phospholipid synthase family protein [Candidatus Eisenbacteria bacterium]